MKKFKMHIISIFIIVLMFIFALGTSHEVKTNVTVKNNSSQDLKLKITRHERYDYTDYSEEFMLLMGQDMELRTIKTINKKPNPDEYIISIIIYNENEDIIKEYNKDNKNEDNKNEDNNFDNLFVFIKDRSGKNDRCFYFIINDEILK
jgi:LAS superfamily LD-carboxypeptidase LdcB